MRSHTAHRDDGSKQVYPIVPKLTARSSPLAWIISDKSGLRQNLLQALGFSTTNIHHDLHSKGHCNRLLQSINYEQPLVLWVRLAGPSAGTGNKTDASRTAHLCSDSSADCRLTRGHHRSKCSQPVLEHAGSAVFNARLVRDRTCMVQVRAP